MNKTLKKQITKEFIQTVTDLVNANKIEFFLKDFLDEKDFEKLVKKLAIAYWLKKGRTNENIKNNLDTTSKEISDVKSIMNAKGVRLALKYLTATEWADVWSKKIKSIVK